MPRELLVLGGSAFVGRAIVSEALTGDWEVTTFNRGRAPTADLHARALIGDRLDPSTLGQLARHDWDLVVDTWSGGPRAVRDSAQVLRDHVGCYAYISSESVYDPPPPLGADESAPTVQASPDAEEGVYPELKRGAEIALEQTMPDRSLFARAGTILGPHEDVGRLTWWLDRMAQGGEILCPGPTDLEIQYVDARDLARFVFTAAGAGQTGPFNVVCRRGHATMGSLLEACHEVAGAEDAVLTWVDPEVIAAIGIQPWEELPIWIPPGHEFSGLHDANDDLAHSAGLDCRSVRDTVSDTWRWLSQIDGGVPLRGRPRSPRPGRRPRGRGPQRLAPSFAVDRLSPADRLGRSHPRVIDAHHPLGQIDASCSCAIRDQMRRGEEPAVRRPACESMTLRRTKTTTGPAERS